MSHNLIKLLGFSRGYTGDITTGYILMAVNICAQIILVPIYINFMGKYEFGILVILLSFVNYAGVGVGGMTGGISRVMGEYVAWGDNRGFEEAYALSKIIYVGYAGLLSIIVIVVIFSLDGIILQNVIESERKVIQWSIVAAAFYFVVHYDLSVERLAIAAKGHQLAGNIFQTLSLVLFVITVVPWLLLGGNLYGVLVCLIGGVIAARAAFWIYWKKLGVKIGWSKPNSDMFMLVKRLAGRMGMRYTLYGAILITMQADTILISLLGGARSAAEFVLVWKIADVLIQIIWRLPEYYQPYLIQMDARGETEKAVEGCKDALRWMVIISLIVGALYAFFGPWIVRTWVGSQNAIESPFAFLLAGGAIFWLGAARLPAVFAYSTIRLESLIKVASVEVIGKMILTVLFFPMIGLMAPLAAINAMHIGGIFLMYRRVIK